MGAGGQWSSCHAIARGARALGIHARVFDAPGWARRLGPLGPALLARRIEAFAPDELLLTVDAASLGARRLTRLAARYHSRFWHFDGQDPPTPKARALAGIAAETYTTCLPLVDAFRRAGAETVAFLPQGVDPEVDCPPETIPTHLRSRVVFVGTGGFPHRHAILASLGADFPLAIWGPGWGRGELPVAGGPVRGGRFAQVVGGADIVLGVLAWPALAAMRGGTSNRLWRVLGAGGFFLGEYTEGVEHFARNGVHCDWFRSVVEARAQIRCYLAAPDQRAEIARAGRAHVLAHHTYAHRLALLLASAGYDGV